MTVVFDAARRTALPEALPSGASAVAAGARSRLNSIDTLRGLVMIVMALDHTRDFFANGGFNPRDVADPALFLTRWVTHFCAPTFIFLAGISAYLYGAQGRTTRDVSRFLATRGIWLVLIEFTVVRLGWSFDLHFNYFVAQVIFAIGVSMVALAAFVHLPRFAIAVIGLAMIAGHNAFDGIKAEQFGAAAPLWYLLHQPGLFDIAPGVKFFVLYPLIPWIGVMAVGFGLGPIFDWPAERRGRLLLRAGAAMSVAFVVLRWLNVYGDPSRWSVQSSASFTVLSFLNTTKYPPSLAFLLMTLGPLLIALAWLDRVNPAKLRPLIVYGSVPLFYFVTHFYAAHAAAALLALARYGAPALHFMVGLVPSMGGSPKVFPPDFGSDLWVAYVVWAAIVLGLYPACRWFSQIKAAGHSWWLRYL